MKLKNKKAQIYPAFVAVFTIVALTFAYVAISNSKGIDNTQGHQALIGAKQAQVFYTLQDAEQVKAFVDQAALNAAEKSFEEMSVACQDMSNWQLEVDGCTPYIHPAWSSEENFCAPDCEKTLKGNFEKEFAAELSKFEKATGQKLPKEYNLNFSIYPNAFDIAAVASEKHTLISLPTRARSQYSIAGAQLFADDTSQELTKITMSTVSTEVMSYELQPREAESKYSFTPSFNIRINKKIQNPDDLRNWAKETWETCTTDYRNCVEKEIKEFNEKSTQYTLSYASSCEDKPHDLFFETMEKIEDCASNGFTTCSCNIDLSQYTYDSDLVIEIKDGGAVLKKVEESLAGIKETEVKGAKHTFTFAQFNNDALPTKKILLDFDTQTRKLNALKITGLDESGASETTISTEGTNISLVKLKDGNPLLRTLQVLGNYEGLSCPDAKNKFRFCASVKDAEATPELFDVKFSLALKEKVELETCKDLQIEVLSQNEKPDSLVKSITEAAGFDYAKVISAIPIPGLNLLGTGISVSNILASLPSEQDANMKVVLSHTSDDIIGYQVLCGQQIPGVNLPQDTSLVLLDKKTSEIEQNIRSNGRIIVNNPYYQVIKNSKCAAPLAGIDGAVKEVSVKKAIQGIDSATFNLNQCSGSQIGLDKLTGNKYCVTVIPVDAQGKSHPECKVTTCTEFNSLFDLSLKELLETQLAGITIIPADLIPKDLKPYIKIPSNDDLIDAATGKKSLGLNDIVDTSEIQSSIAGDLQNMVLKELREEVAGTAFADAIDGLETSKKQAVLAGIAGSIKDEDAKALFERITSNNLGVADASRQILMEKAVERMPSDDAKRVLQDIASGENPSSSAFRILTQKATTAFEAQTLEQKRKVLAQAANTERGRAIKDAILRESKKKNCVAAETDVQKQIECLNSADLDRIMRDTINIKSAETAIVKAQTAAMDGQTAVDALRGLSQESIESISSRIIAEELNRMPDSIKKEIMSDVLTSNNPADAILQREISRMIPQLDGRLDQIMQNGNVRALLEDELKNQLTKQLGLFKTGTCIDGQLVS
jgi:hypothetical protein